MRIPMAEITKVVTPINVTEGISATFKKVTGVSPKDYKNGGQEPERRTV